MANGKPDLDDDGFLQLSPELDSALEMADFTKAERFVLRVVKLQCFGVGKRPKAHLSIKSLAERYGCHRQFVEKGIRGLIGAGVIVPVDGEPDAYRFRKYYRTWTYSDGTPHIDANGSRFSDAELAQIASSVDYMWSFQQPKATKKTKKSGNQRVAKVQPTGCEPATNGLPNGNQRVADSQPTGCIPQTPYKEEYKTENKRDDESPSSPPASPQKQTPEQIKPPDEFMALCRAAKAIPSLEAHRFARTLYQAWGTSAGAKLQAWWDMIPAAEWVAGLTDLIGATEGQLATVNFYVAIVRNPNTRAKRAKEAAAATRAIKDIPSPMVNGRSPDWWVPPPFDDSAKPRTIKFAQGGAA